MSFKVGDKVRCNDIGGILHNALKIGSIYTIKEDMDWCVDLVEVGGGFMANRFKLVVEPQGVKVGDVWANGDKSSVVKVVGQFEQAGEVAYSVVHLKGELKGRGREFRSYQLEFFFPLLLHREPPKQKKQPKPQQPKKEEKRESVFQSNDVFRCGNKIKVVENGFEGFAECNKKDKFDLMFGVNLAAHRARVKYHQWVIEKMLREGAK